MLDKKIKLLATLTFIATMWALLVIGLGAFTRFTGINFAVPHYIGATILGMLILVIALLSVVAAATHGSRFLIFGGGLFIVFIAQVMLGVAALGLKLLPTIVALHLITAFSTLSLLWLLHLNTAKFWVVSNSQNYNYFKPWLVVAIILLAVEIAFGAWTSANYTLLSCRSFPICQDMRWDFKNALNIFLPLGADYTGGTLTMAARQTIQMLHRLSSVIVTVYLVSICGVIIVKIKNSFVIHTTVYFLLLFVFLEVVFGVADVVFRQPISVAIAHNLLAAAVLLTTITLNHFIWQQRVDKYE